MVALSAMRNVIIVTEGEILLSGEYLIKKIVQAELGYKVKKLLGMLTKLLILPNCDTN